MSRKTNYLLTISLFLLIISGCAQPSIKRQIEGLGPNEVSTIKTQNKKISIVAIDGEESVGFMEFMLHDGQWAGEALLRPGEHEFNIMYDDGHTKSQYLYNLVTDTGHTYIIKDIGENSRSRYLYFEDNSTNKSVGKILASINEPIINKNIILDQSVYFSMRPPQEDGWIITYRNDSQTTFAKEGDNPDETYVISIGLVEVPNLESKKKFLDLVESGQKKDTDPKRFNMLKYELTYFDGREDYCVKYHSIAEDKKPVKRSRNKNNMLLEIDGYVCRHPKNKNIAINFGYSKRYYPGNQDNNLTTKSRDIFESLNF